MSDPQLPPDSPPEAGAGAEELEERAPRGTQAEAREDATSGADELPEGDAPLKPADVAGAELVAGESGAAEVLSVEAVAERSAAVEEERERSADAQGTPEPRAAEVAAEVAQQRSDAARMAAAEAERARQERERALRHPDLAVDHVPSTCHVYPTEDLDFLTRVHIVNDVPGLVLEVALPATVEVGETDEPRGVGRPLMTLDDEHAHVRWELQGPLAAGSTLEFAVSLVAPEAEVLGPDPLRQSRWSVIVSSARAFVPGRQTSESAQALESAQESDSARAAEAAKAWCSVEVRSRARYLAYLPAVFERDVLMSRFLMAFESILGPIEAQVREIDSYFSSAVAPLPMVHWLADRLDVEIDEEWDEEVQRRMLGRTVQLYRRRGTRDGLQEMLEVYSGGEVTIVERRAENFRLGKASRLGAAVALGSANQPHTFSVFLKVPPVRAPRREVADQLRDLRRQRILQLIDSERPAHVRYTLDIEEV